MSRDLILFPCWSVAYAAGLALLMMGTRSQFQSRHQDCRGTRRLGRHLDRRRIRRDFDLSRIGNAAAADKILLGAHFRLLETAKELATEWRDKH